MAEVIDEKELRPIIAANVMRLRKLRGWTQQDLAERLGVSLVHVNRLENGHHTPKGPLLYGLADALGVTTDSLRQVCENFSSPG